MVEWWEQVYITYQIYGQGIWALLPDYGTATYDLAKNTIGAFASIFIDLMQLLMYFPMRLFGVMIDLLNIIIGSLAGVMNAIIDLGNSLSGLFTSAFTNVFPSSWIALLGTIILLNIALRVYYFAKDISIAGFKI